MHITNERSSFEKAAYCMIPLHIQEKAKQWSDCQGIKVSERVNGWTTESIQDSEVTLNDTIIVDNMPL